MQPAYNYTRVSGVSTETLISAVPCRLVGVIPEATTAGTINFRDANALGGGATTLHTCAIGLTQSGKQFAEWGVRLANGLTVQPSSTSDSFMVVWLPLI